MWGQEKNKDTHSLQSWENKVKSKCNGEISNNKKCTALQNGGVEDELNTGIFFIFANRTDLQGCEIMPFWFKYHNLILVMLGKCIRDK